MTTIFVCGTSPDLERDEVREALSQVLDGICIGLNAFCNFVYPIFGKTTTYWYGQDQNAVEHLTKDITPGTENIIIPTAWARYVPYPRVPYMQVCMKSIPIMDDTGIAVKQVFMGQNSAIAASNAAFFLGADEVVLIGVDITKTWDYAFVDFKPTMYVKDDSFLQGVRTDFSKLDGAARKYGKRIIKTNPNNELPLEYRSIKEYVK